MNKPNHFKIQTPVGSVESDSVNHLVDVVSVLFVVIIALVFKKLWNIVK